MVTWNLPEDMAVLSCGSLQMSLSSQRKTVIFTNFQTILMHPYSVDLKSTNMTCMTCSMTFFSDTDQYLFDKIIK